MVMGTSGGPRPESMRDHRLERVVAFDLETTGLDPEEDRIVEVCFITLDPTLEELDRWQELVHPRRPIPQTASDVHGITDADVREARPFQALAPFVQSMVDNAVLMAYNHGFDKEFLHRELLRAGGHGIADDHPFIDPMEPFKRYVPQTRNRLGDAVEHYLGRRLDGAHRAEEDTAAMVEVFCKQWEVHPEMGDTLEDLLVEQRDWLGAGRKLYRDAQGTVRYGFGKHEGTPVVQEPGYAAWMLGADFDEGTKRVLRELVE